LIDTTIINYSKSAIEWAAPNVKATECKEWETLENMIDEAGRAKCLDDLLSSHSQSFSSSPSIFQGETKEKPTEDNKKQPMQINPKRNKNLMIVVLVDR
jgi:hypothetical protein